MRGLTERQQQIFAYIRDSISGGYPPTLREIGAHMGIRSTNGVNDHLRALERKGYIARDGEKARAIRVCEDTPPAKAAVTAVLRTSAPVNGEGPDLVQVPVLGRIAAGIPTLAEEEVIDTVRFESTLLRGGVDVFGLRVKGDSMMGAGILNGDHIFVHKQNQADPGDVVVALIGDEATVKYYYPENEYVRFQPANAQMAPILVRAADFRPAMLLGVVIGVFRKL